MSTPRVVAFALGGAAVVAVVVVALRAERLSPQERVDMRAAIQVLDAACERPDAARRPLVDAAAAKLSDVRERKPGATYATGLDVTEAVAQLRKELRTCRGPAAAALATLAPN